MKRVFLIVLDSFGIGAMPDAAVYGDFGSNTFKSCFNTGKLYIPNMQKLGIFNINGINFGEKIDNPIGCFAKMSEKSGGKDTICGHWEMMGVPTENSFPTYPNGFPKEILDEFSKQTGRKILCNKPFSGTELLKIYGQKHVETGDLIVYTSADSVFQIAAHEKIVPIKKLYEYCEIARNILINENAVARVIARPFEGEYPNFKRTENRHDFSLAPPKPTVLEKLKNSGFDVISIGKIWDIFSGRGITKKIKTHNNSEGIEEILKCQGKEFEGLCFANLVDFDMLYGHRNDVLGYTNALNIFDEKLYEIIQNLQKDDILIITADHGCDPATDSTDHSREFTPLLVFGENIKMSINLGICNCFGDIGATILEYFKIPQDDIIGEPFLNKTFIKPL